MDASAYYFISKEVENHIYRHNQIFRQLCMYQQPHWQSSRIRIFLCKYCIVISDTTIGSFLYVFFMLLAVILAVLNEKPRMKDWVTEKKSCIKITSLHLHHFLCHFCCFLRLLPPPTQVTYLLNVLTKGT